MSKKTKKIIVNALTSTRILGSIFLPILINSVNIFALIILMIILFLSDSLDGKLARHWGVQTKGGALLDSFGDKALAVSCIIALVSKHMYLLIPLILEILIILVNVIKTFKGYNVYSSILGKIKTWILSITLILAAISILNPTLLNDLNIIKALDLTINECLINILIVITVISQFITLIGYIFFNNSKQYVNKIKFKSIKEILKRLFNENKFSEDKDKPLIEVLKR